MEKKKIKRFFNLNLSACISRFEDSGIGPILSPFMNKEKVNSFCTEFNNQSKNYKSGLPLRVQLCLFIDNSFFFYIKGVNFSSLLKLVLNVDRFNYIKKNEIDLFDFFLLCILKNNFFSHKKKIYNKIFFLSLINSLNSMKFLIIKNESI
jgi:hypothetical protein